MCMLSGCPNPPKCKQGPWEPPATPEASLEHAGRLALITAGYLQPAPTSWAEGRPSSPVGLVHQGPQADLFLEGSVIL